MADRKLSITITGDAKQAKAALRDLEKSLGQTEAGVKKSGGGIKSTLAGLGVGAALFGAAKAFDESRKVAAQSEAVIKSTGAAANVTADQMGDLANAISKKTGIDDEAIQSGENLIATFTGIRNEAGKGNDIFDQTTRAAVDMSAALGQDVTSAAQMLGKALNDPLAGLSKLTRAGVVFTQQQKDQIKALSEAGDKLGAQKVILAEVNKEFGGSAEAQATSMGKAKVAIDNLAESVGQAMAPALGLAADAASGLADGLGKLPVPAQQAVVVAAAGVAAWLKWGDAIGGFVGKIGASGGAFDRFRYGLEGITQEGAGASNAVGGFINSIGGLPAVAGAGAVGLGLLAAAYLDAAGESERAAKNVQGLIDAAKVGGKTLTSAFNDKLINTMAGVKDGFDLDTTGKTFRNNMKLAGLSVGDLSKALTGSDKEWNRFKKSTRESILSSDTPGIIGLVESQLQKLRTAGQDAIATDKTRAQLQREVKDTTKDLGKETVILTGSQTDAAQAAKWQAEQLGAIAANAKAATERITAYFDTITNHLDGQIAVEDAFDDLTASLLENGDTIDINTEKGRDNVKATEAFRDAAVKAAIAERDRTGSSAAGIQSLQDSADRYRDLATKAGMSKDEITLMLAQMGLTPKQIDTVFITNATETEKKVNSLRKELETIIGLTHAQGADRVAPGLVNAEIQGRASGGSVRAGVPYLVGERGPELRTFGSNGHITPAAQTRALLSGASGGSVSGAMAGGNVYVTVQVAGSVRADRDLAATIRSELTKAAKNRPGQGRFIATSGLGPTL